MPLAPGTGAASNIDDRTNHITWCQRLFSFVLFLLGLFGGALLLPTLSPRVTSPLLRSRLGLGLSPSAGSGRCWCTDTGGGPSTKDFCW